MKTISARPARAEVGISRLAIRRALVPTAFDVLAAALSDLLQSNPQPLRVLDIGAGNAAYWSSGQLGWMLRHGQLVVTLLDPVRPSALTSQVRAGSGNLEYVEGMAPAALHSIGSDSFDVAVAFDLIEHLDRHDGYQLVYEMDRVARLARFIYTPTGFVWQPPSANNAHNAHVSGWTPREFRRMGFRVRGHLGAKWWRGPYAVSRGRAPNLIRKVFSPLASRLPSMAYAFSALSVTKGSRQDQPL